MKSEVIYEQYLDGLLQGNRLKCTAAFEQWLENCNDLPYLYECLLRRALYDVGDLWERGCISVATEHLATAITERLLSMTYSRLFAHAETGRKAVVSCTANEYHQIGGRMVADVFELHGWRGYFLGANTPEASLRDFVKEKQADVVALSVAVSYNMHLLLQTLSVIRQAFPSLPVLVGGQAFRYGGIKQVEKVPGVSVVASLHDLECWIDDQG